MIWAIALLVQYHSWFRSCPTERPLSWWLILRIEKWDETSSSRASQTLSSCPLSILWDWLRIGRAARVEFVFLTIQRYLLQKKKVGLILAPWLCPSSARSVLILTVLHSGFVSRTTNCINPLFFAPILSLLSTWHVCHSWLLWRFLCSNHQSCCRF